MSFTTPIFIPLAGGLDLAKEATLGSEKDLAVLENGDFAVDGAIQGRPSRDYPRDFTYRNASNVDHTPAVTTAAWASTGFTAQGLMRLRDASGERPVLAARGRLFSYEGAAATFDGWEDRGHFACARVDKLVQLNTGRYAGGPIASGIEDYRPLVAQDFYTEITSADTGSSNHLNLLDADFSAQRSVVPGATIKYAGQSARCGTITAAVAQDASTGLWLHMRSNSSVAPTAVQIASDCGGDWTTGLAACICSDLSATEFYVIYLTTHISGTQYKVLRVSTAGSVLATYTGSQANLHSWWLTNTSTQVVVAISHTGGVAMKTLTASTMADASLDSAYSPASGGTNAYQVVVGAESATRVWFATTVSGTYGAVVHIGVVNPAAASSAALVKQLEPGPVWSIVHQPVRCGGRMYLTVSAGYTATRTSGVAGVSNVAGNGTCGTWLTLDLSSIQYSSSNGPFSTFTIVARGDGATNCLTTSGLASSDNAKRLIASAVLLSDGSGWTFPTTDWTDFSAALQTGLTAGYNPVWTLYRVTFSGPRAALAGGSTIFSGSVMHELAAGGECYESGFPFCDGAPLISASALITSGYLTAGDYSFYALWKWTDSSGQVHRSFPSNPQTVTVDGTTQQAVEIYISNPQLTERPANQMYIELYATDVNPTADSLHYLQSVTPWSSYATAPGFTRVVHGTGSAPVFTSLPLYTDADELGNIVVPGDGGITTLGRRVWAASANRVYASKLLVPGVGVSWAEDVLQVDLPAGAGRILALEGMDDKLVVFCSRGVYAIADGGPDNVGVGGEISPPVFLSDLGCAGPRSTCLTDRGVVFCSPLDSTDAQRGGPWLLDRSLSITERQYLGRPAFTYFLGTATPEVAYSPERQQLYVTASSLNSGSTGVIVIDFRVSKWSTWSSDIGALTSITCAKGVLWGLSTNPGAYNVAPGGDYTAFNQQTPTTMTLKTAHLASNGSDGLGWGRVRAVSVLHAKGSAAYNLTIGATLDYDIALSSGTIAVGNQESAATTWPSNRNAPEWRLAQQKCGTIQVTLTSSTGLARWSAIRLDVVPLAGRSPTNDRY